MKIIFRITALAAFVFATPALMAEIVVVSARGDTAYRVGPQWIKPLQAGLRLQDGVKIRTGARSEAVIKINGNTVTIKPLTLMKVYQSELTKNASRTRIGLRSGSVQAKIDRKAGINTSFKVTSPVATSSVRGTEEIISYGPNKGMTVKVISGTVGTSNVNGAPRIVSGNLLFRQKSGKQDPEPMMYGIIEESIANTIPSAVTDLERSSYYLFDFDMDPSLYTGRPGVFGNPSGPATVNVLMLWP